MFRIRRVYGDELPVNRSAIEAVQQILRARFPAVSEGEVEGLPAKLRNPDTSPLRWILLVAERSHRPVKGFAIMAHDPRLKFCFLDFIATDEIRASTGGVGGALYERVREEAAARDSVGLFFECLPDDPDDCDGPEILKANIARMRFYERYGARPIIGTDYRLPVKPGARCMPYLMYDGLDHGRPLRRDVARKVVRTILEVKYPHLCPPAYVDRVVASFHDDPVRIRPPRYVRQSEGKPVVAEHRCQQSIALTVNDRHEIHHVRDRGYVEVPVRISAILKEIEPTHLFRRIDVRAYPESRIRAVHDPDFVDYVKRVCQQLPEGKSVYPYVFPIRNAARPPKELSVQAGYYCIDTFTPLNRNAWLAAKRAVDCCLTAADAILDGDRLAYALVRPPGHHAECRSFGGFCYFCNAAIAAQHLSAHGRVAILDLDYHHGNGQQAIFYERDDVLTVSIHGDPSIAYPYFSGFADERGDGPGLGYNLNFPLPERVDGAKFRRTLAAALVAISEFAPVFLIVSFGLDPARGDPTGTWTLRPEDFRENGRMIGALLKPTLVVQEGGYRTSTLGVNARSFFEGLVDTAFESHHAGATRRKER